MNTEIKDLPLKDNTERHQFELDVNGYIAFIAYQKNNNTITLIHTEVPEALGGKGVGSVLVQKTLDYIEANQQKVIPVCPFVQSYIKKHPEWQRIVL